MLWEAIVPGEATMALKDDLHKFLSDTSAPVGTAIGKIDFSLDTFRVDPEGYRRLAVLVQGESLKVDPVDGNEGSRLSAAYTPGLDKISVPTNLDMTTVAHQSTIIHEMTHALVDYHVYKTSELMDEAIAYIASAVFAAALGRTISSSDAQSKAILVAADAVVAKRKMATTRGVKLKATDADVKALTDAIAAHPSYNGAGERPSYANGIPLTSFTPADPNYEPRYAKPAN